MKLDTLYTERLILRQFSKEDLEDYTAIMTNPQVTCFLGTGKEKTPEDVRQVLIHFKGKWETDRALWFSAFGKRRGCRASLCF